MIMGCRCRGGLYTCIGGGSGTALLMYPLDSRFTRTGRMRYESNILRDNSLICIVSWFAIWLFCKPIRERLLL